MSLSKSSLLEDWEEKLFTCDGDSLRATDFCTQDSMSTLWTGAAELWSGVGLNRRGGGRGIEVERTPWHEASVSWLVFSTIFGGSVLAFSGPSIEVKGSEAAITVLILRKKFTKRCRPNKYVTLCKFSHLMNHVWRNHENPEIKLKSKKRNAHNNIRKVLKIHL